MNIKKLLVLVVVIALVIGGILVWQKDKKEGTTSDQAKLTKMTLALDYTPNTNHTGIYVALNKGWYKEQGIDLELLPYSASAAADSLVIAKKADVGIGFTEGIVADAAIGTPVVSIASIIAHNTSVVLTRKDSGITSPKDLAGKTYGGFGAPFEQTVMTQLIKNDGGQVGEFKSVTIDTSPIDALASKRVDYVWVFDGWEGIIAQHQNLEVTKFLPTDYGIPDYSTPNIISSPETIKEKGDLLKKFMVATAKGYEYARTNPDESAKILITANDKGTFPDMALVYASQNYLSKKYQDEGKPWGVVSLDFWQKYPTFMLDHDAAVDAKGTPVKSLDFASLFTNQFLQ